MNTKSKFTASNTGIARIGTYDSFVEENGGEPVEIGYALNLITSDDLAFKAVAVVEQLPNPKDAAPGLFYQMGKDFYTLNSAEDGFDKVILGADTTLGLTNNLQQQIDTLEAASDVADVVGTKAELDSYPTENLTDRAIVEVMRDETQDDATAYYRYNLGSKSFDLVGVLGVYYTKAEADAKFATKDYVGTELGKINTLSTPNTTGVLDFGEDTESLFYGYAMSGNPLDVSESTTGFQLVGVGRIGNDEITSDNPLFFDGGVVVAPGGGGVVIGRGNVGSSIIIGEPTDDPSSGTGRVAIGVDNETSAMGENAVAIGGAMAEADEAVAIGRWSYTQSSDAFAVGQDDALGDGVQRRIVGVKDPTQPHDAATKNYVDTQLEPINAKLQYVPENTNQVLSQIETNVEKAQSAADAKVASITAGTGITVDDSTPTAPVISTTGLATQASVDTLTQTVNSKADQTDLDALEATVANKADTSALANYATKAELNAKADQTAVDAKVSSVTAGTGIAITGTATAPIVSIDQSYITQQLEAINSTLATLNERVTALEENQEPVAST